MPSKVIIAGLLYSTIFGFSFLFTKNALDHVSPLTFLSLRFLVAFFSYLLLMVLRLVKLQRKPYWKLWKLVLFQPVLYFLFEAYGVQKINSSEAGMIIALIPVVVNMLAIFLLKEKGDLLHYFLVGLGFLGVSLIVGFNITPGSASGKIFMLLAVLSGAMYSILSRKFSKGFTPGEITFFMMMTGAIFFTAFSIVAGNFKPVFNLHVITGALYLGVLSSTLAFFLLNYAIKRVSPIVTTLFSNFTTVVSVVAGVVFRGERVGIQQIVGMVLIIASILTSAIRKKKNFT
ncbi:DMT family transporter [Thermotoga sp.]|uniref:DMT family transporter n=1 Tax=Thermotoga sp. TaxID=28240 RepID=UPI0025D761CE|nr:DMT family transporter [Thermotoga sp.]MCD6551191.1 DMT family transporter [Thermotoga sp.]